jgi:hypothetical protein
VTPAVTILPQAYVSTPSVDTTQRFGRYYTVAGYLKPHHAPGTYPVRIQKWRYVSGRWKYYGYVRAKAYDYKTYTRYAAKLKLSARGKWRLRVYHPVDTANKSTLSGYRYVTVK